MKKIILTMLCFGYVVNAGSISQVGIAYSHGEDKSKNITIFSKYSVVADFGLRLEYSRNISDYKEFYQADINRYWLFATYTLPLGANFSVTPKVGLFKTDAEFELIDTLKKVSDSSTNFTYGVELNYQLNSRVSLFSGYTDYGHKFKNIKSITKSDIDSKNFTFGVKLDI